MKKPELFKPKQEDLTRVGKTLANEFSQDKVVIAGNKKIQGKRQ